MVANPSTDFCPYKGLQPYTEKDRAFFFGRERDQEIIISNLYAACLTTLYGASGVGKSSVLLAGVVPLLKKTPRLAVVVFRNWQDECFLKALKQEVSRALSESTGKDAGLDTNLPLDEFLDQATRFLRGSIFFIFDQFEEYFLYHPQSQAEEGFEAEFARTINRKELQVNFVLSMREDGLSKLDRFQARIPTLLSNMLRLEHLDRAAADAAIRKPLDQYNKLQPDGQPPIGIEDKLVEALLEDLKSGKVTSDEAGQGQTLEPKIANETEARIETPFLQMVLTRLWDEERAAGSRVLRLEKYEELGRAEKIARTHLDRMMEKLTDAERDVAASMLRYLVTPSGTKIAQEPSALASWTELSEDQVQNILNRLSAPDMRILRTMQMPGLPLRYEIFHDVLAQAILDWRTRYVQERKKLEDERRLAQEREQAAKDLASAKRHARRLRWGAIGLSALLFVTALSLVQVFRLKQQARSREKAAYARAVLNDDPELSVILAMAAVRESPTQQALDTLRHALETSRMKTTLIGHTGAVRGVRFSPDGQHVATAGWDETARVWETATGKSVALLQDDGQQHVLNVAFSPDGNFLATAGSDGTVRVWNNWTNAPRVVARLPHPNAELWDAEFSPDGKFLVTGSSDSTVRVWDWQNQTESPYKQLLHAPVMTYSAVFGPDGKQIAIAGRNGSVLIWEWENEERVPLEVGKNIHKKQVRAASFSHDGKYLITACDDWVLRIWDWTAEGGRAKPLYELQSSFTAVRDAAFSPDDKLIATVNEDHVTRLWSWQTDEGRSHPVELHGHTDLVFRVAFSMDGRLLATGSEDRTVRIWNTQVLDASGLSGNANDLLALAKQHVTRRLTQAEEKIYEMESQTP